MYSVWAGEPGKDGYNGTAGQKGNRGANGKSHSCWVSFPQHQLIMSSLLYLTYNVAKLPTHVCVLVSEVM